MANNAVKDPVLSTWFGVEVAGKVSGAFQECSGLGSTNEVAHFQSSTQQGKQISAPAPGRLSWSHITLKRGVTDSLEFWKWREMVEDGKIPEARANATITAYNEAGSPVAQWDLINAWPCSVTSSQLSSSSNEMMVEEIELVHEGCKRTK